jgi:glycosyltransferase involved in cell wall biosynthesis
MLTNKIGINSYMLEQSFTGIEIYTKKLIDGIKERNINIELYSYSNLSNHPEYSNILKSSKNEVCIGQLKKLFWNLIQINSLVSNDTYIFHAPSFILPYFLPSKLKKIITVHDLAFLRYPQYATFKEKLYYKLTLKHSLKNADIIIAISKSTQNDIEEFFPEYSKKIKLIYNGYEDFSKIKSDDNIIYKLKIKPKKYFLVVGTLHERKNIKKTIESFNLVNKQYPEYKLVIVGRNGDNIREKYNIKNKNIIFAGYVSNNELATLYKESFLFLFLSFYEGFGFPILEAMSCGIPVVTSNNSSLPEISGYSDDLLVNPNSKEDISEKMIDILSNDVLYKKLVLHSLKQIKKFSWEKMINETISQYNTL